MNVPPFRVFWWLGAVQASVLWSIIADKWLSG
jgi:hypothetical protein